MLRRLMAVQIAALAMVLAVSTSASAAARPDLVVPRAKPQALQAAAGGSVTVKVRVRNAARGTAARRSVVRLLLSRDARRGGDQVLRPATRIGRLRPRKTSRRRVTLTVPGPTKAGSYYVLACADATKRVRERRERNNCRAVARLLVLGGGTTLPAGPDIDHDGTPNTKDPDADGDGVPNVEDCLPLDPAGHPGANDEPDPLGVDADCNGIDGHPAGGKDVFVWAGAPNDAGAGTQAAPKRTLTSAIMLADQQGGDVYATTGTYASPSLRTGVNVYGGYDPQTWARQNFHFDPSAPVTVITGTRDGIYATGVHSTKLQLLRVTAQADLNKSRSVYGIRAVNYSDLVLDAVDVRAGNGIGGVNGFTGATGATGAKGGNGQPGLCDDGYEVKWSSTPPWPKLLLSSTAYDGEAGGAEGAPANADGTPGIVKFFSNGGPAGQGGGGAYEGGSNGSGASPATGQDSVAWGGTGFAENGQNGAVGPSGTVGAAGAGATGATTNAGSAWAGMPGGDGKPGAEGGYGGGGGGGAGNDSGDDGSGGGGGAGGQGGKGGGGGKVGGYGGGSFGVYAYNHSNVTLIGATHITTGNGGKGGTGGEGGLGGKGGTGGLGGKSDCTPTEVGYGGNGGNGGIGGQGGAGGGGAGGPSIGVMLLSGSTVVGANAESMALGSAGFGGSSPAAGHAGGQGKRAYVVQG